MYEIYHACNHCMNRKVLIHTVYGQTHRGVIVGLDEQNVYLDTAGAYGGVSISSKKVKTSAFGFGPGFGFGRGFGGRESILTLALFDLLAIALIS